MKAFLKSMTRWVANENDYAAAKLIPDKIEWLRTIPFVLLHLSCLLVYFVGVSSVAVWTAAILFFIRIFAITGIYHRYFSHKTYSVNRFWQFMFGVLGSSCVQRGPLWWASHHRQHHMVSDQPEDAHSPSQHGFWWSHMGWFLSKRNYHYNPDRVKDLSRFPELVFLDRYDIVVPAILFVGLWIVGKLLYWYAPQLGTNAGQMIVWGFCISTIFLFHATVTINSLSHVFGGQRFVTTDTSRNNFLLAMLTLGEGWHNNHHHYPATARQGFVWWEIDITYYILNLLAMIGIVKNIKKLPKHVMQRDLVKP